MRIIKIEIPLKFEVSSINSYLIDEEPLTLIDPGPFSGYHIKFLEKALNNYGKKFSDIKRILLTHGHTDHGGIAGYFQKKFNTEIYIHEFDEEKITKSSKEKLEKRKKFFAPLLKKDGFPDEVIEFLINFVGDFYKYVFKAKEINIIEDESIIGFNNFKLKVLHTPGHTAGHVVFIKDESIIFSGDVLLKDIFVTPLLEFDECGNRRKNLLSLISTFKKLKNFFNFKWYVAHGSDDFDKKKRIKEIEKKIFEYIKRVRENFNPKLSVYENFKKFYPDIDREKLLFYISMYYGAIDFI